MATVKLSTNAVKRLIDRLRISQKIGYTLAVSIGIATLGTAVGLALGDIYRKQALEQLALADEQQHLLTELELAVLEVRFHPQRLVGVLGESIWFEYEKNQFYNNRDRAQALALELERFARRYPQDLAANSKTLSELSKRYQSAIATYAQFTQQLWQQLQPANLKATELQTAQQQILTAIRTEQMIQLSVEFERLSEQLDNIIANARQQQLQAQKELNRAEILRGQIIVISMLLSVVLAIVLAFQTSRAIAHPLETVTNVAERAVREANFNLKVPITTKDEIASLASSLNQLIHWVGENTYQLELARDTLELRVEERTQELTQALQELQKTQSQLIHSEKMSSLGQLVAGVAHEINNPVNFIHGNLCYAAEYCQDLLKLLQRYQEQYPNPTPALQADLEAIDVEFIYEDLPKILTSMQTGTQRIREIVLSLRNFSRLDEAELKWVDLHEGIESTLMILQNRLKSKADFPGIQVIKQYSDLPKIECYPGQLNQVVMNLITNAIDALEESTKSKPEVHPTIWIRTEVIDEQVTIQIIDNGLGIPEAVQQHLFDPFFTTKPVGRGTGLGLSISYQIVVERHGGQLQCSSSVGVGTKFAIAIPLQQSSPVTTPAKCL